MKSYRPSPRVASLGCLKRSPASHRAELATIAEYAIALPLSSWAATFMPSFVDRTVGFEPFPGKHRGEMRGQSSKSRLSDL